MTNKILMQQMFEIALDDLAVARQAAEVMYPKRLAIACCHCQQCAEKAMKGYLHHKEIDPPKIHDLPKLCRLCTKQDSAFSEIAERCSLLTPFGTVSRYPNEQNITEATAAANITRAQEIYDFCKARVSAEATSSK